MDTAQLIKAIILGIVEGGTEFLPVSSTGHLILAGHFLQFDDPGATFKVVIQLGAVLAIVAVYFMRFLGVALCLPTDDWARKFVLGIFVAFLPAAVLGAALHKYIKAVFEKPIYVCIALIVGGVILLLIDRMKFEPKYDNAFRFPVKLAFIIGCFQCLALFAGVSRSGSTIVGGMLNGTTKRSAAEFSFFLALPTMAGAFAYDLYKSFKAGELHTDNGLLILIGFVVAFLSGLVVVRFLLDYVSRHGFALFGWWRIIVGVAGLGALLAFG